MLFTIFSVSQQVTLKKFVQIKPVPLMNWLSYKRVSSWVRLDAIGRASERVVVFVDGTLKYLIFPPAEK